MHVQGLLQDYTMSMNLSVYAPFAARFVLFMHLFACISDLPGFFASVIIIFFCSLSKIIHSKYDVKGHLVK